MTTVAEDQTVITPEDEAAELADRAENIKIAIAAAEGERERRMSADKMGEVQEQMNRERSVSEAKQMADDEQASRVAESNKADVMSAMSRQANIAIATEAAEVEKSARVNEAKKVEVMNDVARSSNVATAKASLDGALLEQVFESIMKQNSGCRWFVCKLTKNKKGISNEACGTSWVSFVDAFKDSEVMWGCFAVHGVDQRRNVVSVRTKPVGVSWVGSTVPPMKRMQAMQGSKMFNDLVGGAVAVRVSATDKSDLNMKDIAIKIADCGGAHKPSHYDFCDTKLSLADIGKSVAGDNF
jgi:hypothetical protein